MYIHLYKTGAYLQCMTKLQNIGELGGNLAWDGVAVCHCRKAAAVL